MRRRLISIIFVKNSKDKNNKERIRYDTPQQNLGNSAIPKSMEEAEAATATATVSPISTSPLAYALCRFSTSGVAVGVATTVTHPMGNC